LDDKDVNDGTFHLLTPQDDEERHLKLVELNVIEQCLNLYKTGALYVSRSAGCDDITHLV